MLKTNDIIITRSEWTGINYPRQWEVKYEELRNNERLANSFSAQPLTFDKSTSSFWVPDECTNHRFTPPLIRSTSSTSYNNAMRQAEASSVSTYSLQPSFLGLHENEHHVQHTECLACHKIL